MVSVLASSVEECGFKTHSGKTKDYKIDICCIKEKEQRLVGVRNQDNNSMWCDMYPRTVVSVSQHYQNPTKHVGLEQSGLVISLKINLFSP